MTNQRKEKETVGIKHGVSLVSSSSRNRPELIDPSYLTVVESPDLG
jgi:hypothetical protein